MTDNEYHNKHIGLMKADGLMLFSYWPGYTTDYLTEHELLSKILTTHGLSPFLDDGRIRFNDSRTNAKYRIHDLAFACYHGFVTSYDTWRAEMQAYLDWKHANGLTMDHADSNGHNNTVYNLSLIPHSLNSNKSDIVSRFKVPVYLTSAYVDDEYRVRIVWDTVKTNVGSGWAEMLLVCADAESYVDCLRSLSEIEPEWYQSLASGGKRNRWKKNDGPCVFSDIGQSIVAQIELSKMERSLFNEYHTGGLSETLTISRVERMIVCERA